LERGKQFIADVDTGIKLELLIFMRISEEIRNMANGIIRSPEKLIHKKT
jgi:hypothetical protein